MTSMKDSAKSATTIPTQFATIAEGVAILNAGVLTDGTCPICGSVGLATLKCKVMCVTCNSLIENCNGD